MKKEEKKIILKKKEKKRKKRKKRKETMNSESRFSEDAAIDRIALGQLNRRAVEIRCDGGTRAGRNDDAAVL